MHSFLTSEFLKENVLVMNKAEAEKKITRFTHNDVIKNLRVSRMIQK